MLLTQQITPCYRFGGCWVVSTSLEFLKISIYFSSNRPLHSRQERKTDGQDADTAGPGFFNCLLSGYPLLKAMKYRIMQYKSVGNQFKLSHMPTKTTLHQKAIHALVLKNV